MSNLGVQAVQKHLVAKACSRDRKQSTDILQQLETHWSDLPAQISQRRRLDPVLFKPLGW